MAGFTDLILSLDGFGEGFQVNFKGSTRLGTYCGSLITTFVYVVFLLYSLQQGIKFVGKQEMNIASYDVIDLDGAQETLKMKDWRGGFMFRLKDLEKNGQSDGVASLDPRDGSVIIKYI